MMAIERIILDEVQSNSNLLIEKVNEIIEVVNENTAKILARERAAEMWDCRKG